jgi:hypothetical protein
MVEIEKLLAKTKKEVQAKRKRLYRLMAKSPRSDGEQRVIEILEHSIKRDIETISDYEDDLFYEKNKDKPFEERMMLDALRQYYLQ